MFRLTLGGGGERKASNILEASAQLDHPYSLLTHDKNAGNDVQYILRSVKGKNIKGPYILYYGRAINIAGFKNDKNEQKISDGKIETPKDETKNVVLRRAKYKYSTAAVKVGGKTFEQGPYLMYGFYKGFTGEVLYDEEARQHIFLGKKALTTGDATDREYDGGQMQKFPSLFLEKDFYHSPYSNAFFQLEYTDDSSRKVNNEIIEIVCELYRE